MLKQEKTYYFIDFEYAGLDNPNKTILDILCQPNHEIDSSIMRYFIAELGLFVSNKSKIWERELLRHIKLMTIKWCFIMMNRIENRDMGTEQNIIDYYNRMSAITAN